MIKKILHAIIALLFVASGHTAFSEDERYVNAILFSRYTGANWQIWAKNLDTEKEYMITGSPMDKKNPQWLYRDNALCFRTANSELYKFNIDTKAEEGILPRFGVIMDQNWSAATGKIVFARLRSDLADDSDIWVSDITGENSRCLTNETGLQYSPVFSPDAEKIAYICSNKQGGQTVHVMNSDGSDKRPLTKGRFFDCTPAFSPNGELIAFSSNRKNLDYDIWTVEVLTGKINRLTHSLGIDSSPVFSPDGERIAFVSSRSGSMQIWVMGLDGSNQGLITNNESAASLDPAWIMLHRAAWSALIKKGEKTKND